jgi:hypothetical protein
MKLALAILSLAASSVAQTPDDVLQFLRSTASVLANAHEDQTAKLFLESFDRSMPGYPDLSDAIERMVAQGEIGSAIEIVSDEGDNVKRTLELDWVLEVENKTPRRQILKCTIERKGKKWKFTSLTPIDFFKY